MAGVKNRRPAIKTVLNWLKQGYGQGSRETFKPYFYVRDVPSQGSSNMVFSRITRRTHHYLSDVEFSVHLLAEYAKSTVDIREQYALLPWDETQSIASQLGIRHPRHVGTKTPTVLTTDLLLSLQEADGVREIAISVKSGDDLTPRDFEKLLLESIYWQRRGITWTLVTKERLPQPRSKNLRFFENSVRHVSADKTVVDPHAVADSFKEHWNAERTYLQILHRVSAALCLDQETAHIALGRTVWNRTGPIDIDASELDYSCPVQLRKTVHHP